MCAKPSQRVQNYVWLRIQGGKSETSVLPYAPVFPSYSLRTPSYSLHTPSYFRSTEVSLFPPCSVSHMRNLYMYHESFSGFVVYIQNLYMSSETINGLAKCVRNVHRTYETNYGLVSDIQNPLDALRNFMWFLSVFSEPSSN